MDGIKYYPKPTKTIKGKIAESMFHPCYCHETTRDGKPKKSCSRCKGRGGTTDIWVEPLIVEIK
jgi:hypothetical protein